MSDIIGEQEGRELTLEQISLYLPFDPVDHFNRNHKFQTMFEATNTEADTNHVQSGVFGSEYAFSPTEDGYFIEVQNGFRQAVDRESYLEIMNMHLVAIRASHDDFPAPIKEYYLSSNSFLKATAVDNDIETRKQATADFIVEHNEYCQGRREEAQPLVEATKKKFELRVRELVDTGKLPQQALRKLDHISSLSVVMTDKKGTAENSLLGGIYDPEASEVSISIFWPKDKIEEVLIHEFVHAISGHRVSKNLMKQRRVERVGVLKHPTDIRNMSKAEARVFRRQRKQNEALTQMVTNLIRYPEKSLEEALQTGDIYAENMDDLWSMSFEKSSIIAKLLVPFFTDDIADDKSYKHSMGEAVCDLNAEQLKLRKKLALGVAGLAIGIAGSISAVRKLRR
jgi:hypothetical protein